MKTPHLILAWACLAGTALSQDSAATIAATAERAIERAYLHASTDELAAAVQPLDAALATDHSNPALLYERGFAHFAAATPLRVADDKDGMEAAFNRAVAVLEKVRGQPWEAEAAALESDILGQLIALKGGMAGMAYGPKSGQLIGRALKALPNSPRVLFVRGSALLNTPTMFGGNPEEGAKFLQRAVDAFAAADPAAAGPHWGRVDALTWLGIAKQKAGDLAAARSCWEQALALEPENKWVKFALLPSLDQKSKP